MKIEIPYKGKDAFKFLKENKQEIIMHKKSATKYADMVVGVLTTGKASLSAKRWLYENDEKAGVLKRSLAINTSNWLDSHDDVHVDETFGSSIKQKAAKQIPHLHDHVHMLGSKVGEPIEWKYAQVTWRDLGVNKDGTTYVLVMDSEIKKDLNPQVYDMYLKNEIDQHSIGMQYVKIDLAINEPEDDYWEEEYKVWKSLIDKLGNPEKAEAQGYFFAVYEGKAIEGSAVLFGSNELTPTLGVKFEPSKGIQTKAAIEPATPFDVNAFLNKHYK